MKIATVRDLRNNFAKISRWLEDGQEVEITKRGVSMARLVPSKKSKSQKRCIFDAVEHRKWIKKVYGAKVLKDNIILTMRKESDW